MTDNNSGDHLNTPASEELLIAGFERLSIAKQVEVFGDFIGVLNDTLGKLNDHDLSHHCDLFYSLYENISLRLDEVATIYGLEME